MRFLFILILALLANIAKADSKINDKCTAVNIAFYINDRSTDARIAYVNHCNNRIISIADSVSIPFDINNEIIDQKLLPQGVIYQLMINIEEAKKKLNIDCRNVKCIGIASGSVAKAIINNQIFYDFVKEKYDIKFRSISNAELSKLNFIGILAGNRLSPKRISRSVILDISSDNIGITNKKDEVHNCNLSYSYADFKKDSRIKIKGTERKSSSSILPLNKENQKVLSSLGKDKIKKAIESIDNYAICLSKGLQVFGVGDIITSLYQTIALENGNLSIVDIFNQIDNLFDLESSDISLKYPLAKDNEEEFLFKLLYFLAVMSTTNIEQVNILESVEEIDGLLIDHSLFKE